MKINQYTLVIAFCGMLFVLAGSDDSKQVSEQERFEQYLIGIKYLEAATDLSVEEKVAYYNKLVELTGFSADKTKTFLDNYKDDPQKWEKIISSVVSILEKSNKLTKE